VNTCVVVFAREPVPGEVKTRLREGIGAEAAAHVYAATLEHTLEIAKTSGARVVLSLADVPSGAWARRIDTAIEIQRGADIGDRMDDAFARRFGEGEQRVVIIGSDCPWSAATCIAKASAKLGGVDAVLGPTRDGGYWLVAQRPPGLPLFTRISWSSPETLEQTRARIRALGGTWSELEELIDIDTADDLEIVLSDPRTPETLRRRLRDAIEG
jgi:rSAM/selenodomain-associated transferase 1